MTQQEDKLTLMELKYKIVARFTRLPAATACLLKTRNGTNYEANIVFKTIQNFLR